VVSTGAQRRDLLGFSTRRLRHLQFQPHSGRHPAERKDGTGHRSTASTPTSQSVWPAAGGRACGLPII